MIDNEKYAKALDKLIDAKDEIARLRAELAKPWLASDEVARLPESEKRRRINAAVAVMRDKKDCARLRSRLESAHVLLGEWIDHPKVGAFNPGYNKADLRARTRELLDR